MKNHKIKSCTKSNKSHLLSSKMITHLIIDIYQLINLLNQQNIKLLSNTIQHKQIINYSTQLFENTLSA